MSQHVEWGQLHLEPGDIITIERIDHKDSGVSRKHYPQQAQVVRNQAVVSMEQMGRIERYE